MDDTESVDQVRSMLKSGKHGLCTFTAQRRKLVELVMLPIGRI